MEYEILKPSCSPIIAEKGCKVSINATGFVGDSEVAFWSSKKEANPVSFQLGKGEVIRGWDISCEGMRKGEVRKVKVPSEYAYGEKGSKEYNVPPNADLVYEVELVDVEVDLPSIDVKEKGKKTNPKGNILFMHGEHI